MKTFKFLAAIMLVIAGFSNLRAQTPQKAVPVEVYYFHATNRCVTCQAVEDVTREALKQNYGNQIQLKSINSDEESSKPLLKKYKVAGQSLLILKGNKIEDLTSFAFLNARTKPEQLKEKIKKTIDKME